MRLDFSNNKIEELPRKEFRKFLEEGGELKCERRIKIEEIKKGGIAFDYNPLAYPPQHIYESGKNAVLSYVQKYDNRMIEPDKITLLAMGKQCVGKTSLIRTVAEMISNAAEVKKDDRTHVFDIIEIEVEGTTISTFDVGGHQEYECTLPLLNRKNKLQACIIEPSDVDSKESLDEALGDWMEKIMIDAVQPHFIVTVTRIDEIKEDKYNKIAEVDKKLRKYISSKEKQVSNRRQERLGELEKSLKTVEEHLSSSDVDPSDRANHQKTKSSLEAAIAKQTFKVNHPPNFNKEYITFVSSLTKEGLDVLKKNLKKSVSILPKVKLQAHWEDAAKKLLSKNEAFVTFDDFLKESGLEDDDLIQLLKALEAQGLIVLAQMANGRPMIFPNLAKLSEFLKAIFYHEMDHNIIAFADHKGIDGQVLLDNYHQQGKIPVELVEGMYLHLCYAPEELGNNIKIDFTNFTSHLPLPMDKRMAISSLMAKMQDLNMLRLLDEEENGLKVCCVPHLISYKSIPELFAWVVDHSNSSPFFSLAVLREFETNVSSATFAACHNSLRGAIDDLAKLMDIDGKQVKYHIHKSAVVACLSHYEILLQKTDGAIVLQVNLTEDSILPESVWIIMNDLVPRLGLEEDFWKLTCPLRKDARSCNHGDYHSNPVVVVGPSLETVEGSKSTFQKRIRSNCPNSCVPDLKQCFPSTMATQVMTCLHPADELSISPLVKDAESILPRADYIETQNLVSVLLTEPMIRTSFKNAIKLHPALMNNETRFLKSIQPVRQHIDDQITCKSKNHSECGPDCKRDMAQYVKDFPLIEQNGPLVTRNDWVPLANLLVSSQMFKGEDHSVAGLTRGVRNMGAHNDPNDPAFILFAEARSEFEWLIMHDFSFWVQYILKDPDLEYFSKKFFQLESKEYQRRLKAGELKECPHSIFEVKVTREDGFDETTSLRNKTFVEETRFFFDVNTRPESVMDFLNKVRHTIPLPKPARGEQWKV